MIERNKVYEQFILCESLLDIYGLCLQEEPVYIPLRYRRDKIHVLCDEEKNVRTTANLQNMQCDMEILKIRRDNYKRTLSKCDETAQRFITEKTGESTLTQEITSIWNESTRQDQEKVDQTWARKIASMHTAFEKDKATLSRRQAEPQIIEVDESYTSETDTDDEDQYDEIHEVTTDEPVQRTVRFSTKEPLPKRRQNSRKQNAKANRQAHQGDTIRRTIQNDTFIPPAAKAVPNASILSSKNDQRHQNQKDRGKTQKKYPLRSSIYLDSISRTINSDS